MNQTTKCETVNRVLLALVQGFLGLCLLFGGTQLVYTGGSYYFLIAGLALCVSARMVLTNNPLNLWIYGAILVGTLLWTLWEVGLDPWQLQARLLVLLLLGIWVFWRLVWRYRIWSGSVLVIALVIFFGWLWQANKLETSTAESAPVVEAEVNGEWLHYGNNLAGQRYAPLTQISPANIENLEQAWVFNTGDDKGIGFEATPLMISDVLYLCSPRNVIFALDADTGKQIWKVDPEVEAPPAATCRGVAYFKTALSDGTGLPEGECIERIIFATTDARLMAVDSKTGLPCTGFGDNGTVDLKRGMGEIINGYYYVSSAPTIVRGNVVLGGWVMDGQYVGEPSGVIRAYDAVTGEFSWAWDMDRPGYHGEPPEGSTYSRGTPNSWGPMSGDESLGLVYVPTGNSTPDYWGAHRSPGSEKYSSSVVALDADTGSVRWYYQTVHHDLWDYDVSAQPTLIDLQVNGEHVPALVQATKRGQIFLLDRRNGALISPVEERKVPQGAAEGDYLSPTQPFTTDMPTFDDTLITAEQMWGLTPLDMLWCRIKFRKARYEGPFTPPGLQASITYPSYLGGINWGGVSVDPEKKLMTVNWSRMANYTTLVTREESDKMGIEISKDGGGHVGYPVPQMGTPFAVLTGPFLSPIGVPCTQPPFGKITVVDLEKRATVWEKPLGTGADSGPFNIPSRLPIPMGVPNSGGSLMTASNLIFIAATQEKAIRAYESTTGRMLWKSRLPAGGHASPATYQSSKTGRQYIVIAAGGNVSLASGAGDSVVAFALKQVQHTE